MITTRHALPIPPPHPDAHLGSALRPEFPAGFGLLFAVFVLGWALGAIQVIVLAYTSYLGNESGAALVFFVNSAASLAGAFIVGGMTFTMHARHRFTISLLVYAVGIIPSALVTGYWPFVVASALAGAAIAPTFVQANAVVADETPARIRTSAFALLSSAVGLGIAIGAAVAGAAASAVGGDAVRAMLIPLAVACAVAAILVDLAHRRMRAAGAGADDDRLDPQWRPRTCRRRRRPTSRRWGASSTT